MAEEGAGDPGNTGGAGDNTPTFQDSLGEHGSNDLFSGIDDTAGLAAKAVELNTSLDELRGSQPAAPENVDAYEFDVLEGSLPANEESTAALKEFALEKGWSPETFKQAKEIDQILGKQIIDAHNAKVEDAQTALKQEMGDAYEQNVDLAQKVLIKFGSEGLKDRASDLASDPDILRLVVSFGKAISPDVLEGITVGQGAGASQTSAADKLYDGK